MTNARSIIAIGNSNMIVLLKTLDRSFGKYVTGREGGRNVTKKKKSSYHRNFATAPPIFFRSNKNVS